jgi:WD40 repeat protein
MDLDTKRLVSAMRNEDTVSAVTFSPDGKWILSGSHDGTVRAWEAATGFEMTRMAHEGGVNEVAFSPDGRWVVSGSDDYTTRVWLWQPQDIAALLCARLPRNFTQAEWRQFFGDVPYHPTCENLPEGE